MAIVEESLEASLLTDSLLVNDFTYSLILEYTNKNNQTEFIGYLLKTFPSLDGVQTVLTFSLTSSTLIQLKIISSNLPFNSGFMSL
jgi:hypothetical protein